ncbi:DUF4402 domain-containing protein [Phenylobacterium sp. VNQ135]|uniref:DUF4402 domain-containing protein n=1 Tax=Phenylobacterium sp. VNQ135 TaxID=3400922 RepID=UPI003C0911C6
MRLPSGGKISQLLLASTIALLGCVAAGGAQAACTLTYGSLSSSLPNLGNVVSAATNETVFRVAPTTGTITKISGDGVRTSTGTSVVSMTISTANHNDCNNLVIDATLTATGSTNRGKNMNNFDVAGSTNAVVSNESGSGATRTFKITMQKNKTGTIYIGMDFPIKGDNEGGATGASNLATSSYSLALNAVNGNDITRTGSGRATVRRSLKIVKSSDLSFGRVVRPSSGSNTVAVNATTGLPAITGAGNAVHVPPVTVSRAAYQVTGEGGQTFTLAVPSSATMSGPGGNLTVTLTKFPNTTSGTLSGSANSDGTYDFWVGGSFPITTTTESGTYTGAFTVTVTYN